MRDQHLREIPDDVAIRHGLAVNNRYWKHYVDADTNQLHVAVDLEEAYAFIVGHELIVTDKVTMEQVGRLPAPDGDDDSGIWEQCGRCGKYHPVD